jgi:hypothetical protein
MSVPRDTIVRPPWQGLDPVNIGSDRQSRPRPVSIRVVCSWAFRTNWRCHRAHRWSVSKRGPPFSEGRDRATGETRWTTIAVDRVFGSNSQRRSPVEVYASDDARAKLVHDFVKAWDEVMTLDRFDLA